MRPAHKWTLIKGGKGFRLRNVASETSLGAAVVANTPANTYNQSVVAQDDKATEFQIVQSSVGYEWVSLPSCPVWPFLLGTDFRFIHIRRLRLATDPKLLVTIWNLDAGNNSWVSTLTLAFGRFPIARSFG